VAKRIFTGLLLSLSLGWLSNGLASDAALVEHEYQLKTAYLFHFAELTEWSTPTPVTICLLGQSPLRAYLPVLENRQIHGHVVHVLLTEKPTVSRCQILFLSDVSDLSPALLAEAQTNHVLLVSDTENFAHNGGMIQFMLRNDKLKLLVNLSSVKQAGLKLSSKLLRMAEILE